MTAVTSSAQRLARLIPPQCLSVGVLSSGQHAASSASGHAGSRERERAAAALTTRALLAANAHVGHSAHAQHSSMLKYVFGVRGGVSVLNLDHTLVALRRAAALARAIAASPSAANSATSSTNTILFVGTRPALHALVVDAALASGAAFLTKWVGGTLTNAPRVLRRSTGYDPDSVAQTLTALGGIDVEADPNNVASQQASSYSKRPRVPSLVILLDLKNNMHAVRECNQLNIPIIAICDSDCDASAVQYPIPANDDSLSSVGFIAGILANAIREGAMAPRSSSSPQQSVPDQRAPPARD